MAERGGTAVSRRNLEAMAADIENQKVDRLYVLHDLQWLTRRCEIRAIARDQCPKNVWE